MTLGNKHGRMKFTAQGSRFNFTIKGPDLWGAKTSGFIEMDFDAAENGLNAGAAIMRCLWRRVRNPTRLACAMPCSGSTGPPPNCCSASTSPCSREWYAESAEDGPLQMTGTPTARMAQIRFSQTFLSDWTVAALIGDPNQD